MSAASEKPTRPHVEPIRPEEESTRPHVEPIRPEEKSTRPHVEPIRPEEKSTRPHVEPIRPEEESTRPDVEPARIGLVDYGMGNRRSAEKALEHVGARVLVSSDPARLREMDGLVLPGVGALPAGMRAIRELGLDELLIERAHSGVPLLGLCLGMQLLFEHSEEHDGAEGLGLLAGTVRRLSVPAGLKLPHIGWSEVRWRRDTPLAEGLPDPSYLYHVHSFAPVPAAEEVVLATAEYGEPFAAIVGQGNVYGTQSHPEKSSTHGLALLANFTRLCGRALVPAQTAVAPR
jgi:glutamine amidotransferase